MSGVDPYRGVCQRMPHTLSRSARPPSHQASTASTDRSGGSITFRELLDVGVQRRTGDPHEGADLLHGALPRPVEIHRVAALFLIEPLAPAADAPPGAGGSQAGAHPFADRRPLELLQRAEDVEDELPRYWS